MTFSTMTVRELRSYCVDHQVSGYSKYTKKADLCAFLEQYVSLSLEQQQAAVVETVTDVAERCEAEVKEVATALIGRYRAIRTALSTREGVLTLFVLTIACLALAVIHAPSVFMQLCSDAVESGRMVREFYNNRVRPVCGLIAGIVRYTVYLCKEWVYDGSGVQVTSVEQ